MVHRRDDSEVDYLGAAIDAGSRDDPDGLDGLAHFVEHVLFKGTQRRRSWHIINRMERCGGELNAYTTKETTVVYTVYPYGNFLRAADLLSDLLCNSIFPPRELSREREVVADEISQYRDIPSEAVFDDFEDLIFAGSRLGHNILGTTASLEKFTSDVCLSYLRSNFTAQNMVIFYAGRLSLTRVERAIERFFATLPPGAPDRAPRRKPIEVAPFDITDNMGNHQDNTIVGTRIGSMFSQSRHAIALLSNILGGPGMNSLLNVEMRERRGLVYAVESSAAFLTDTGLLTIFFGCDPADTPRCRRIVADTLGRIASGALTERFVEASKRQYIGQMALASDVRDSTVMSMARAVLYHGSVLTRTEAMERIKAVTTTDLRNAAATLIASHLSTLTLR